MKTHNHLYDGICAFENLVGAAKAASRGKRFQDAVGRFNTGREAELLRIRDALLARTYRPGPYRETIITIPKKRMISAAPFCDRVVHHAVCRVVMPLFEKKMIPDLYSNRRAKGTHAAIRRCQEFARQYHFVLKCDISKYFPSIDHALLKGTLRRTIRCRDTLWLLDTIIDGSNPQESVCTVFPGDDLASAASRRVGLPLGNLTSQWFGNCFLSPFDHWVQEELRCGAYVRYVDDFLLFSDDKDTLQVWREALMSRLVSMRLRLHARKTRVFPTAQGVSFLGQRIWPHHRRLLAANVRTAKRRFRKLGEGYVDGRVAEDAVRRRWASWMGHAMQAGAVALVAGMAKSFDAVLDRQGQTAEAAAAGRHVEQQYGQPALRLSQQQRAGQQQQQYRVPLCEGDLTARTGVRTGGRNGMIYGSFRRSHAKAHLTRPVSRVMGMRGTNMGGRPGAGNAGLPCVNVPGFGVKHGAESGVL